MAFPSRAEYEILLYSLPLEYPGQISSSTLRPYSTSALTARVEGALQFASGLELRVREFLDFRLGGILDHSYTVYRGTEKIRWYDSQSHSEVSALASTFPHHYHDLPDIKHNRCPAPGISFAAVNLPALIADCLSLA
jgi:hypothetical protein